MQDVKTNNFLLIRQWIAQYLIKYDPINNFSSKQIKFISFFYNIFISLFSFAIAITPIFISIINKDVMNQSQFGIFILINLILFIFLFLDWILFISVCNIYYQTNNVKKILISLLKNIPRLFQFTLTITMFIVYAIFISFSSHYIFSLNDGINQNIFQIIIFIALFLNVIVFFQRFFINVVNTKKISILKTLFFKRMHAWIYSFLTVIIFTFIFAYIIFLTQVNTIIVDHNGKTIEWTYWQALWFCFVTITTIGYGDLVVTTTLGKFFTIPLAVVGIICYTLISALFISMLNDYNHIKDELRKNAKRAREKHIEHENLLKEINKVMLHNLFKAKVIDKKTYQSLLNNEIIDDIVLQKSDNEQLRIENDDIYFNDKKMGIVKKKNFLPYMAVFDKPENTKKVMVMKKESISYINKSILSTKPIFFADLCDDENISNIVLYTKRPHRLAYCDFKIATSFILDKDDAWIKYGKFSDLSKTEFYDRFMTNDDVCVFVVEEKRIFDNPMLLESFGIYSNSKVNDVIYLI